jgi:hypothetical protein
MRRAIEGNAEPGRSMDCRARGDLWPGNDDFLESRLLILRQAQDEDDEGPAMTILLLRATCKLSFL